MDKLTMTIREAAEYAGFGINKMRQIAKEHSELVLMCGSKSLIKRKRLEKFIEESDTI